MSESGGIFCHGSANLKLNFWIETGALIHMNKSNQLLAALASAGMALGALSGVARAEDPPSFAYSWTVTGASDYLFRGISFTSNDPTVNSYLEFTYGIAYMGLWTSNIDSGDCDGCLGPWEQDIYLGIRPVTGPINWDMGLLYYYYRVKGSSFDETDLDYFEFKIAATTSPITNLTLGATVYYLPDQDIAAAQNVSVEGTAAYALPQMGIFTPTVSGLIGFSNSDTSSSYPTGFWLGDDQYTYWNAGVKLAVEKFSFDFRYWDTNLEAADPANNNLADSRFLFTAAVTLP